MLRGSGGGEAFFQGSRWESRHGPQKKRGEERFLSAQADRFAGAKRKEKASACSVRNDGRWGAGQTDGASPASTEQEQNGSEDPSLQQRGTQE